MDILGLMAVLSFGLTCFGIGYSIGKQLDNDKNAVWGFLLVSGYLKAVNIIKDYESGDTEYELALTNAEVRHMFIKIIRSWFPKGGEAGYDTFEDALLNGDLAKMNTQMNKIFAYTFSYFDTGRQSSGNPEPERFYYGFMLGLMINLQKRYDITSNRESGDGRYDVMLSPLETGKDVIILEFKTCDAAVEKNLKDTAKAALQQIIDKKYAASLEAAGVNRNNIRIYGFAFSRKEVLIDGGYINDYEHIHPPAETQFSPAASSTVF